MPEPSGGVRQNRVLVTGASGFVGRALVHRLNQESVATVAVSRRGGLGTQALGEIDAGTNWDGVLNGTDTVVHLAARVHVMRDRVSEPLQAFRTVNVEGTRRLGRRAAFAGVRRVVFISSVKVHGETTAPERPFQPDDPFDPSDAYARSKVEAEQALGQVAAETGLEVVVIRPPVVYGPGVGANFARLMQLVRKGVPLPLGAVDNRRSLVGLDNLVDLLVRCIDHPAAAGQVFLAGDGEDVSTTELLRRVARAMDRPAQLLPVPPTVLRAGARLLGKGEMARRLLDSLQVDITHTRETLGWEPPVSLDEGLRRAVANR